MKKSTKFKKGKEVNLKILIVKLIRACPLLIGPAMNVVGTAYDKWPTVHDMIKQETAAIVFKSISGLAPTYLSTFFHEKLDAGYCTFKKL